MNNTEIFLEYENIIKTKCRTTSILTDEPMCNHTSFKIGGPAKILLIPETVQETIAAIQEAKVLGLEIIILGHGTNLLVTDEPINKVVIKMYGGLDDICLTESGTVYAESGAPLSRIAVFAMNNSLTGFEFAHGIPGTLGGAVMMNAGAYGGEMKDVVVKTTYLDKDMNICTIEGDAHVFSYRHSVFSETENVILSSEIKLSRGNPFAIMRKMKELSERRKTSQPLDMPSAGSTFKRPKTGYAAAMIEEAGLKGKGVGGACVSEKHAGFIINKGNAKFEDVLKTMELVQNTVYEKFGVMLEPEVKIIY